MIKLFLLVLVTLCSCTSLSDNFYLIKSRNLKDKEYMCIKLDGTSALIFKDADFESQDSPK